MPFADKSIVSTQLCRPRAGAKAWTYSGFRHHLFMAILYKLEFESRPSDKVSQPSSDSFIPTN